MNSDQSSDKQPRTISNESSLAALPLRVSKTKLEDAMDEDQADFETPAIEFRNVDFSYDDNKVLNGVNFQVARGEIKIILSGSGGGKSTILKLILGLLKPDAGQIFIDGEEITECDEIELQRIRDKLGMVFQEGALFDSLTVYENVAYRLQERDMPEKNVEEQVLSLLKFVKLEKEMDKLPSELSGGMRKR